MSTNPFEERPPPRARSHRMQQKQHRRQQREALSEPEIWAARNVEWPLPSAISVANYVKLVKSSKQSGQVLGMTTAAAAAANPDVANEEESDADSNYYGFTGFMSRVLNTSATAEKSEDTEPTSVSDERPLRPPRTGCVAAANGWIVAVLECSNVRLVSRWNVRRGGMADQWMVALPPPVTGDAKIMHVFVDPTASHTFLSAANGECYYIHSSQKQAIKLPGFGVGIDGSPPKDLTSVAATSSQTNVQSSVTMGTFVTAIAWDRERGTEGSSKKILLGTSGGEIYEYALVSPNAEGQEETSLVLLHKLYTDSGDPTEVGAAVTGIFFERLRTGLLVLAATSGRHKYVPVTVVVYALQHFRFSHSLLTTDAHGFIPFTRHIAPPFAWSWLTSSMRL
jgi:hypothetical protein